MNPAHPGSRPPPAGLVTGGGAILISLLVGVTCALLDSRRILEAELVLLAGGIGFAIFYSRVRGELSLVSATGAYLIALASLFATLNNLRVLPEVSDLPRANVSDLFLLLGGVVLLVAFVHERSRWPSYPKPLVFGAAALALSVAVTTAVEPGSGGSRSTGLLFLIGVVATPIVVAAGTRSRTALLIATTLWLISGAFNGLVAFLDFVHLASVGVVYAGGRVEAFTDQPNHLGLACAMLIPIGVALAMARRQPGFRLLITALTACVAVGVLVSGSRSATISAVVGMVMVPILAYRQLVRTILLSLAALLLALIVYAVFASYFVSLERLGGQVSVGAANVARIDIWEQSLAQIARSPIIGIGFGSVLNAHDILLQLLVAGGVIALVGYAFFSAGVLVMGWRCSRSPTLDPELSILSAGLTSSVLLFLVSGLVSNELFDRFIYWPFGLIVAVHFMSRQAAASSEPASPPASQRRAAMAKCAPGPRLPAAGSTLKS